MCNQCLDLEDEVERLRKELEELQNDLASVQIGNDKIAAITQKQTAARCAEIADGFANDSIMAEKIADAIRREFQI